MKMNRRGFLKSTSGLTLGAMTLPLLQMSCTNTLIPADQDAILEPDQFANKEYFWKQVADAYTTPAHCINIESGYYSASSTKVTDVLCTNIRKVNQLSSLYMRKQHADDNILRKKAIADFAGCATDELFICRNTTEALTNIILGLRLHKGDEVLKSNMEYNSMVGGFKQRVKRDGIKLTTVNISKHPKDKQEIVQAFEQAITARTKVILASHMIFLNGQILPIREISDMAHAYGVEVIADGAHSFAHLDFSIPDLHCDYFGTSLHKWLGAPMGTGLMYIKKEKIPKVTPLFAVTNADDDDITKFEHLGTNNVPAEMTILNAIAFHKAIGGTRKEERLRYLKNYWVNQVKHLPGVEVHTPLQDDFSCAISTVGIKGMDSLTLTNKLYDQYKVFTVNVGMGTRVSPNLYTRLSDLDLLVKAFHALTK